MKTSPEVREWYKELGRIGGARKSEKKTLAARKNAKLGGWPRGKPRRKLHATMKGIYLASKHAGLTNNSLTAGRLDAMAKYADDILELAELLHMSLTPDVIQAIYRRAELERERGEVFELSQAE